MADFNFLTGQQAYPSLTPGQSGVPAGGVLEQGPWNQAQAYPSMAPGQHGAATQGLDWGKIGQWAMNQPATQSGGYQQALAGLSGMAQPAAQLPHGLSPGRAGGPLGTINQQAAGYIGPGMIPAVLPANVLRAR